MSTPSVSSADSPLAAGEMSGGELYFIGAMPPPLNGQSNCNRAMFDELTTRGVRLHLHDIGGTTAAKLRGAWRAMWALLTARRTARAYLSVPGNKGVWLFVPLAMVQRWRRIEHYVHHHSFRPINLGPTRAMRALVAAGGRWQRHILLSDDMRRRFIDLYLGEGDDRALSLSNAYLFGPRLKQQERPERPVTLGHMSVLTREKGVAYLLALFTDLIASGRDWRLVVAGSCADPELVAALDAAVAAHPDRIEYRGPLDGEDKEQFFEDIDLFVLPTTLIDEAEPLVMLEAFGRGVDVVANDTGCIRDRIRTRGHLMTRDLVADGALIAARVFENAASWVATRAACIDHARAIKALADAEAAIVFPKLVALERPFAINTAPVA